MKHEHTVNVHFQPNASTEHFQTAVLNRLEAIFQQGVTIMSAISDFAAKVSAHNDKMDAAISGLQGDVQGLKDEIAKLQSTQGQITPEDQALLDGIESRAAGISDRLDALDSLTPPVPPT